MVILCFCILLRPRSATGLGVGWESVCPPKPSRDGSGVRAATHDLAGKPTFPDSQPTPNRVPERGLSLVKGQGNYVRMGRLTEYQGNHRVCLYEKGHPVHARAFMAPMIPQITDLLQLLVYPSILNPPHSELELVHFR